MGKGGKGGGKGTSIDCAVGLRLCSILIAVEELSYRPTLMCKLFQSAVTEAMTRLLSLDGCILVGNRGVWQKTSRESVPIQS